MKHNPEFLTLVKDAQTRIEEMDIAKLHKMLEQREEKFILIDVREDNEWQRGHIPTAIHLSKGIIERDIEKFVPDKTTTLVLYCGGGYRSALATDAIQKMGYKNVYSLQGGFGAWFSANYTIDY